MRTHQLALLPACALPGCRQAVTAVGEPCSDCQRAFGAMLRHQPHGQPLIAAEIDARDNHVRQAYQHQRNQIPGRDDRRRNQTCWLCAERRTCTRTSAGWGM